MLSLYESAGDILNLMVERSEHVDDVDNIPVAYAYVGTGQNESETWQSNIKSINRRDIMIGNERSDTAQRMRA